MLMSVQSAARHSSWQRRMGRQRAARDGETEIRKFEVE